MRIRASESQTPIFKTMYAQCMTIGCGAQYSGSMSWDYCLSPSGMDKPRVVLPLAPSVQRMKALRENHEKADQLDLIDELESEEQ